MRCALNTNKPENLNYFAILYTNKIFIVFLFFLQANQNVKVHLMYILRLHHAHRIVCVLWRGGTVLQFIYQHVQFSVQLFATAANTRTAR